VIMILKVRTRLTCLVYQKVANENCKRKPSIFKSLETMTGIDLDGDGKVAGKKKHGSLLKSLEAMSGIDMDGDGKVGKKKETGNKGSVDHGITQSPHLGPCIFETNSPNQPSIPESPIPFHGRSR